MFLIGNQVNFLYECGFLKSDINNFYKEIKNILLEVNEENLDQSKTEEESILEKFLKK